MTLNFMKYYKLTCTCILLSVLQGCQSSNGANISHHDCSKKSPPKLDRKNVEAVTLASDPTSHDGILNTDQSLGFQFTGKKNQKITYQLKPHSICA